MADTKLSNLTQTTSLAAGDLLYAVDGSTSSKVTVADLFANSPVEVKDVNFALLDDGDTSKRLTVEVSAIANSTTRTLTYPDQNVDLAPNSGTYPDKTNALTAGSGLSGGGDLSADRTFSLDTGSNRNVDHSAVSISTGTGLSGGGDLTSSWTLALDTGSNRNVDHSTVNVLPGSGLTGGGDITADRTLSLSVEQATDHDLLPGATIVASFIYDTRKDSDGGAWRQKVNHLSWAQEPRPLGMWLGAQADESAARNAGGGDEDYYYDEANADFRKLTGSSGTAVIDRGARQGFPQVALVTAEVDRVVIWDGDDPNAAMWMVFVGSNVNTLIAPGSGDRIVTDLVAANGKLFVASKEDGGTPSYIHDIDFLTETGSLRRNGPNNIVYKGTISERNNGNNFASVGGDGIVNRQINAVAAAVLPQTPPDPNRLGLPTPTVIPFTDGGLSHIASDGSVYDVTRTGGYVDGWIDGNLIYAVAADGDVSVGPIPFADTSDSSWRDTELVQATAPAVLGDVAATVRWSYGSPDGLTLTDYDAVEPANSGVAHVTKDYATPYMVGAVELCFDGSSLTDRSVAGTTVTDNGTATFAAVATGADAQATTASGGSLTATVTSGGECYGWENDSNGNWQYRRSLSEWTGVSESGGTLTIADGTEFTRLVYTTTTPKPQQLDKDKTEGRRLLQENAKALLGGTSNNVRNLAYDPDGDRLIAATGDGTSAFHGLERTAHYATGDTGAAAAGPNGRLLLDARAIADSRSVERLIEGGRVSRSDVTQHAGALTWANLGVTKSDVSKGDVGLGNVPNEDATNPANWDYALSGADTTVVTGTAGSSGNLVEWNADGDAVGSGVSSANLLQQGKHTIGLPAAAWTPRATDGAEQATIEFGTNNLVLTAYDFDAATEEAIQVAVPMPVSSDESAGLTAIVGWTETAGNSGDVVWGLSALALGNDDAIDSALGTEVTVTDTRTAQGDLMQTAETATITPAGTWAAGDLVLVQLARKAGNGSDTLGGDARFVNLRLFYTINAATDA